MAKIEHELKEATSIFSEKKAELAALQRKKGGNLMVADANDVLAEFLHQQIGKDA